LEAVVETPPAERAVLLEELCGADEELRREVESFLAFENQETDLLEETAFSAVLKELGDDSADNFAGRQIGKYRILRQLGAGGMGIVFLAERTDGEFEQQVAVKLLRRSFFDSSAKSKFQKERQILARLRHPFIAQLLDGGTTEENTPFLVMEYVEGTPITRYAQENNLSLSEKLDLFRKVCEAVSFAHRNLIVHRDLKPDNILINADGVPKLLDFGIAKLMSENEIKATVTRHQPLTPEYASPEQITGGAITTATDVYGLGIILFELITGQRPFASKETTEQIILAKTKSEPERPSSVVKTKSENPKSKLQTPKLKGDLDNIVLKALKKEPERRYKSVELFAEDIRRHQTGLPVTARADTYFYRAEKFVSRNPIAVAAVFIAFISLLGALFVSNRQAKIARAEGEKAARRFNDVRQLTTSFIFEINEKIDESPIKARELLINRAIEYLDKLAAESEGDVSLQSEIAAAYEKIGDVQAEIFKPGLGNSQGSLESHQKALLMRETIFAQNEKNSAAGLELVKGYIKIGNALTMTGNTAKALDNYKKSVALGEKLHAAEPKNIEILRALSRAYAMNGQSVLRSGSISEALNYYEKAVSTVKKALEIEPENLQLKRNLSAFYSYAGYAKLEMGKREEALRFFSDALAIEEDVLATDPNNSQYRANRAIAILWVGIAQRDLNLFEESIANLQKALAIQQEIFAADRANFGEQNGLADCYLELGYVLFLDRQIDASIDSFQKAIDNYESVARVDTSNVSVRRQIHFTRRHLADALAEKGEIAKALKIYEELLPVFREIASGDPNNTDYRHDVAICHFKMGEALLRKNERQKAAQNFAAAMPILEALADASPENVRRVSELQTVKKHLENLHAATFAKF
jgi:non-specific serine/threonine protein kinase/serine/threonine-protein kinase